MSNILLVLRNLEKKSIVEESLMEMIEKPKLITMKKRILYLFSTMLLKICYDNSPIFLKEEYRNIMGVTYFILGLIIFFYNPKIYKKNKINTYTNKITNVINDFEDNQSMLNQSIRYKDKKEMEKLIEPDFDCFKVNELKLVDIVLSNLYKREKCNKNKNNLFITIQKSDLEILNIINSSEYLSENLKNKSKYNNQMLNYLHNLVKKEESIDLKINKKYLINIFNDAHVNCRVLKNYKKNNKEIELTMFFENLSDLREENINSLKMDILDLVMKNRDSYDETGLSFLNPRAYIANGKKYSEWNIVIKQFKYEFDTIVKSYQLKNKLDENEFLLGINKVSKKRNKT